MWAGLLPYCDVGLSIEALKAENTIEITLNPADIEIFGLELALYRNQPGFNK